ncbi:MAG: NAD-dependent epimerase/dehydratase family protein, partial [Gammaproteobacteria bacterium]
MNILITGSASHLANASLPVLLSDSRIDKITGIDAQPSTVNHPAFECLRADICNADLARYFQGIDAVIHLAFIDDNGKLGKRRFDREYIRNFNVSGTENVAQLAAAHSVKTLIVVSSAVVYGFARENPAFVSETQPLTDTRDFYYAEDKVAVERWLDTFEQEQPQLRIVRLRPHCILGEHAQPLIVKLLKQPFHLTFQDPQPLLQCVSEVDVATAILLSLFSDAYGAFNLATDEVASLYLAQKHLHRFSPPLPYGIARRL